MHLNVSFSGLSNPRDKFLTRRALLSRRDAITAHVRDAASGRIADRVRDLLVSQGALGTTGAPPDRAGAIALYARKDTEVDTVAIDQHIRDTGGRVAYPRVIDDEKVLEFHDTAPAQLIAGRFSLREPQADTETLVPLSDIHTYIIPGLAFDRTGWRIGWGRGHYDATLAASPNALRIGLAFECQMVDHVPHEPHDAQLHYIVTELATYKAS